MARIEVDALLLHIAFGAIAAAALLLPLDGVSLGVRILVLVVLYNIALPAVARWRGHDLWLRIWAFVLPISILQIVPDWFLAEVVGSLVFNAPGLVRVGAVPMYMGLMWTIPLFLVIFVGLRAEQRRRSLGIFAAVAAGLVLFGGSEVLLPKLAIWEPVDVKLVAGIAVYILPAECVLCAVTYAAWKYAGQQSPARQVLTAIVVMFSYLGAAATFYLFVEVA
ncbi:MAG: DUF6989 domain-containing protein [Myxococcota bacterium]